MYTKTSFKLIVTIVDEGCCGKVVEASKKAGAEGGTIIKGRGSGIHEQKKLFNLSIEPEKDIVLTLVPENIADKVAESIEDSAELNKPGTGVAFILDLEKTLGINHLIQADQNS